MLHVPSLMRKLDKIEIQGQTLCSSLLDQFINNRSFRVKVGTEMSDKLKQENGTLQGSIISPTQFQLMINDLKSGIDSADLTL